VLEKLAAGGWDGDTVVEINTRRDKVNRRDSLQRSLDFARRHLAGR